MDFWRIAMRPGKPLMFAAKDRARVLGLPGNPVSTMVCALLFLKPAMDRMLGHSGDIVSTVPARLAIDVKENDQREDYVRSKLTRGADGSLTVEPHKIQDSSMLSVLAWCDAFMIRPPHDKARKAGDTVQVIDLAALPGGYCEEVSGQAIVTSSDASEVFEAAEGILDAVSVFVGLLVEAEWLLSVDRLGMTGLVSRLSAIAVIGDCRMPCRREACWLLWSPDETLGYRAS